MPRVMAPFRQHSVDLLPVPDRSRHQLLRLSSLGIDVNALYMGCNMFSKCRLFVGTNGYVIRKSSIQGAGPMTVTMF